MIVMVLGGIVAWFLPVAGLIWNGSALAGAWRNGGWMKKMAIVFCALSLLTTAALFLPTTGPAPQTKKVVPIVKKKQNFPDHSPDPTALAVTGAAGLLLVLPKKASTSNLSRFHPYQS